ncbi:hypothetical protein ACWIVU_09215 [Ursidibacter arcticus]|nr:transposase [Ursidibacter arcticus]
MLKNTTSPQYEFKMISLEQLVKEIKVNVAYRWLFSPTFGVQIKI